MFVIVPLMVVIAITVPGNCCKRDRKQHAEHKNPAQFSGHRRFSSNRLNSVNEKRLSPDHFWSVTGR
jgi:hypothetical protein